MHDHRRLGRELELFDTDPLIGAGLPYWLPAGAVVRHTLEEYVRDAERRAGYRHVYSPVLGKRERRLDARRLAGRETRRGARQDVPAAPPSPRGKPPGGSCWR